MLDQTCSALSGQAQSVMVPIVIGIVEAIKRMNIVKNDVYFAPISIIAGICVAVSYAAQQGEFPMDINGYINLGTGGIVAGLAAAGLFGGVKKFTASPKEENTSKKTGDRVA